MIVRENISFERGLDPRDSMRIGKWARFKGMETRDVVKEIYGTVRDDPEVRRILDDGYRLVLKEGFGDWDDYFDYVEVGGDSIDEIDDYLIAYEDRLSELIDNKFPIRKDAEAAMKEILFSLFIQGLAVGSNLYAMEELIDTDYLNESISFERGRDPKEAMGIGDEGLRILNKLSTIAQSIGAEEIGIDDLNTKMVLGSWRIPGVEGPIEGIDYGRIVLYRDQAGEYKVHTKGVRGTDVQQWQMWNSPRKWIENTKMLKESINFERGRDPRVAMGVGDVHNIKESLKKLQEYTMTFLQLMMTSQGLYLVCRGSGPMSAFTNVKKYIGTGYFDWNQNFTKLPFVYFKIKEEKKDAFIEAYNSLHPDNPFDVNESVNFERGMDPKDSMGVGMRIFDIDGMGFDSDNGEFTFDQQDTEALLSTPGLWTREPYRVLLLTKLNPPKGRTSYSLSHLAEGPGKYDYVRYKDQIYPIPNPKNRITESVNFKRRKDPMNAMGIGNRVVRDIQKIDKFVKSFGFERVVEPAEDTHLKSLAEWLNPELGIYLTWYYYPEKDQYFFYTEKWDRNEEGEMVKGLEYEGSLEDLFHPGVFQNILDGEPMYWKIIKESINFERGTDPMDTLKVGNYQERIIKKGLTQVAEFFGEPWLKEIIPEYTKDIMETGMIIENIKGISIASGNMDLIYIKGRYPDGDLYETTMNPAKSHEEKDQINIGVNIFFPIADELRWQRTINRDKFDS